MEKWMAGIGKCQIQIVPEMCALLGSPPPKVATCNIRQNNRWRPRTAGRRGQKGATEVAVPRLISDLALGHLHNQAVKRICHFDLTG